MEEHKGPRKPDMLLAPFLQATNEAHAERHLERLLHQCAGPIIQAILQRKWRVALHRGRSHPGPREQDADEAYSEVIAQLLARLRAVKAKLDEEVIGDFRAYVAVTTYRVCDKSLRQQYPERWSLKNRLRYLLAHRPGLALWHGDEGEWLCGFTAWRDQGMPCRDTPRLCRLRADPQPFVEAILRRPDMRSRNPADLLAALFDEVGQPLDLDELTSIAGALWGIESQGTRSRIEEEPSPGRYECLPDPHADVAVEVDQRLYLRWLWTEICQLRPRQRAALLLNLRDGQGNGIIALLPLRGVARIEEIARTLDMSAERFAALWNDLPLDDATIAQLLGVTRQQVINSRKAARERLARRVKSFEEET